MFEETTARIIGIVSTVVAIVLLLIIYVIARIGQHKNDKEK